MDNLVFGSRCCRSPLCENICVQYFRAFQANFGQKICIISNLFVINTNFVSFSLPSAMQRSRTSRRRNGLS